MHIRKTLALLFVLLLLASGCTSQMWHHGWAVKTSALYPNQPGYEPPIATMDSLSNVTIGYSAGKRRLGIYGDWKPGPNFEVLRITNTVSAAKLLPVTNEVFAMSATNCVFPTAHETPQPGTDQRPLPIVAHSLADLALTEQHKWIFPDSEGIMEYGQWWYWYVPPPIDGAQARLAMLTPDTEETSASAYVLRMLATPFCLLGDAVFGIFYSLPGNKTPL